uniref:Retrotransposon gag domain-containing protein n=1 Tax=Hyaloperonospora arabidopsidis (strain Emoy2) TaxID=559515 RepID=M4BTU0_HYAAE
MLWSEQQRVGMAISKLGGRAREWALTCSTSVDEAFTTWDLLKQQISRVFDPPNQASRVRSHLLSACQGKKELSESFQKLRTLIAAMQLDPIPEMVLVTIFMEGLRTGVAQTEVLRVHPTSFEEAVDIALNAEFNFKADRFGTHGYNPNSVNSFSSLNRPEHMYLSLAKTDEEAELQAVEHHRNIRRCFTARQASSSQTPAAN